MKSVSQAFLSTLQQDNAIKVKARLLAEWEYNRFYTPTMFVSPDQSGDTDWATYYGNTASMVQPSRPTAGIAKARLGDNVIPETTYRTSHLGTRYYPSYEYDQYMYWSSLQRTNLVKTAGAFPFNSPIIVSVEYPEDIAVNKIVFGYELGYCKPVSTSVQISTDNINWTTIANDPVIGADGICTIYAGIGGLWDITPDYTHPVVIRGVRLTVYSTDTPYSHVDILQISPRLENDLSDLLVKYDVDFSTSSPSFIAPLGKASSNTASITLSNFDGRFNNENTQSLYYQMIQKKVRFTMDMGIDTSNHGGSGYEYVREFTMWSDSWSPQTDSTVQVSLKDSSVIMQETGIPTIFLENQTTGGIIMTLMDTLGMNNYAYSQGEHDDGQVIPYYWPSDTGEKSNPRWGRLMVSNTLPPTSTVWDEISALAESTQTAVFFDEYDVLQIVARKSMYNRGRGVNWNLDALRNGLKLPDVVDTTTDFSLTTNRVEITYRPCSFSLDQNGLAQMEKVWTPTASTSTAIVPVQNETTADVTLRAAALFRDFLKGAPELWISSADARVWPWESDVNIEGEILHYVGKEYGYYTQAGVLNGSFTNNSYSYATAIVTTQSQQDSLDALSPDMSWKNAYTGRMVVTARGLYGTVEDDHLLSDNYYSSLLTSWDNGTFEPITGYVTYNAGGYITQSSPIVGGPDYSNHWNWTYNLRKHESQVIPPGNGVDGVVWYGAKVRFGSGHGAPVTLSNGQTVPAEISSEFANWHLGGLYFAGDWGDAGYFLELTSTGQIDGWEKRTWRHELCLIGMPGNAPAFQITGNNADSKGFPFGLMEDLWYQVDVRYEHRGGWDYINVYMNSVLAATWSIEPIKQPLQRTNEWRFGTHVRGPSSMDIDYLYAAAEDPENPLITPDQTTFIDLVNGDYASAFVSRNVKYGSHTIDPTYTWPYATFAFPQVVSTADRVLDEYGPVVHEIRTFNVEFDKSKVPVESSFLYLSNPLVDVLSYQSDAYGAEFVLANASRNYVILNGTDSTTVSPGGSNSTNQVMFIWGRCLYTASADRNVVKTDDDSIRRQGLIRTQFTSRYIQTDEMANAIGDWVIQEWSGGVDQVTANLFGNPLIQLGDLVTMNYPTKGMLPATHQYYVTDVKGSFDSGYKTTVTLRRAKVLLTG